MTNYFLNRIITIKYYLTSFLFIGLISCSIVNKPYTATEIKHEWSIIGEIKENNLIGFTDTLIVSINGKVSEYDIGAKNIELEFLKEKKIYKTKTDLNGNFKLNLPEGIYQLKVKNLNITNFESYASEYNTITFNNLNFKSRELRELIIYIESIGEYVEYYKEYKSEKAYKKHLKEQYRK
jgi:hypothetical protein